MKKAKTYKVQGVIFKHEDISHLELHPEAKGTGYIPYVIVKPSVKLRLKNDKLYAKLIVLGIKQKVMVKDGE
jgi:hypothetical protein